MIRVQNQNVVRIVNNATTIWFENTNNMDKGFYGHWAVKPTASKIDSSLGFCMINLQKQDLCHH